MVYDPLAVQAQIVSSILGDLNVFSDKLHLNFKKIIKSFISKKTFLLSNNAILHTQNVV